MAVQRKLDQPVFVSPEEYLAFERASDTRHEYRHGEIVAMSGATRVHNLLSGNVFALLWAGLRGRGCESYTADMRVRIPRSRKYCYPDVVVACGSPEFEDDVLDTLTNPVLIVEVLSESTEAYDRGEKFLNYQRIESLGEYVLVSQSRRAVERFVRQGENWTYSVAEGAEATVTLESVGVSLRLADLYEGVEIPAPADDAAAPTPVADSPTEGRPATGGA